MEMTPMEAKSVRVAGRCMVQSAVVAFAAGLLLAGAPATAHDLMNDGDQSNDWIAGLKNSSGHDCCGNNDCRPVAAGSVSSAPDGRLQVEIGGTRFPVPEPSIVPDTSPDGRVWVCPDRRPVLGGYTYSIRGVRCLLLPPVS